MLTAFEAAPTSHLPVMQANTFQDWMRIDAAERRAGERHGRPRIKMTCPQMMWDLIGSSDLAGVG